MIYKMGQYGGAITNEFIAEKIATGLYEKINTDEILELDFSCVSLLTTTCIKKIFNKIKNSISEESFFNKFHFKNVDDNLKVIISHGLENLY